MLVIDSRVIGDLLVTVSRVTAIMLVIVSRCFVNHITALVLVSSGYARHSQSHHC